jgi:hypothetical protein
MISLFNDFASLHGFASLQCTHVVGAGKWKKQSLI